MGWRGSGPSEVPSDATHFGPLAWRPSGRFRHASQAGGGRGAGGAGSRTCGSSVSKALAEARSTARRASPPRVNIG
ncbi:hypothetical protein FM106_17035 [Brachybacterium faecium]|nr:hypothetical protein FM106_17035 [Brachybacterium faecium]